MALHLSILSLSFVLLAPPEPARAQTAPPDGPPPAAPAAKAPEKAKAEEEFTPQTIKGLNFEGLSEPQVQTAISILKENSCDCGCGMKLAKCRRDDSTCTRSLGLGTQIVGLVKDGKTREEVVKAVFTSTAKYVQFDLPAGDAPAMGPADAKVTILHYMDYQ